MAVGAIIGAAIIGAGTAAYTANKQKKTSESQLKTSYYQQYKAVLADAEAIKKKGESDAEAAISAANAEATAYRAQGAAERDALYAAAEEARSVAYENIAKMQSEANESLRQLEAEQTSYEAKARAKAAASGVRMNEGSTGLYLTGMEEENKKQYGWLQQSYQSGINVTRKTANQEYNVTRGQGDVAYKAGNIRANAALAGGASVAGAAINAGIYSANALKKKAQSYLDAIDSLNR